MLWTLQAGTGIGRDKFTWDLRWVRLQSHVQVAEGGLLLFNVLFTGLETMAENLQKVERSDMFLRSP